MTPLVSCYLIRVENSLSGFLLTFKLYVPVGTFTLACHNYVCVLVNKLGREGRKVFPLLYLCFSQVHLAQYFTQSKSSINRYVKFN